MLSLSILSLSPSIFAQTAEPLDPEVAFALSGRWVNTSTNPPSSKIEVRFDLADGYYLYRQKIRVEATQSATTLTAGNFPKGIDHQDEYFGKTEIYRQQVVLPFTVHGIIPSDSITIKVISQGCADLKVCYPPQEQMLTLNADGNWTPWGKVSGINIFAGKSPFSPAAKAQPISPFPKSTSPDQPSNGSIEAQSPAIELSDSEKISSAIGERGLILSLFVFFGLGVALSLTPCNLPMVPILGALITGSLKLKPHDTVHVHTESLHEVHSSRLRGLMLAAGFVLGMSITYAIVGSIAGLTGNLLSVQLQLPAVQIASALMMLVLAGGCFGWYSLQVPSSVQSWLRGRADSPRQGSLGGLVFSGALSALIVGPCVAAPLAGLLIYIGQQGNAWYGALLLFALAWGQGLPLLAFGLFADRFMPKLGAWMEGVNRLFGFLLIAVALWFVSALMPVAGQLGSYGMWLVLCAVFLRALDPLPEQAHGFQRLGKALGLLMLIAGLAMWLGLLSGATQVWPPLSHWGKASSEKSEKNEASTHQSWKIITSTAEFDQVLQDAGQQPLILDYYADWCVSCQEMELTFKDPRVQEKLKSFILIRADVTRNTAESSALLKRFGLFGPPALLLFNRGKEDRPLRLVGFETAESLLSRLSRLK